MVVQFSYGFTADGDSRDLSFLDWGTFRRWIATDCDRPFFESTCFYESRNSKKYSSFIFQTFPPFLFRSLCGDLVEGCFPKFCFSADSTRCGCVCLFRCSTFLCFQNPLVCTVSVYFWFPILNHSVVSSIFFCLIFNRVDDSH